MQTVLTIAGFDPSSGAGVTADLMVFAAHGLFGTSCITGLTVQSTLGVRGYVAVSPELVRDTLDCLESDLPPAGIKIGMLGSAGAVETVANFLLRLRAGGRPLTVVLDPVMYSSSGKQLLEGKGVAALRERLLPLVDWVTPNVDELAVLVGRGSPGGIAIPSRNLLTEWARELHASADSLNMVLTGGHLEKPDDLLMTAAGEAHWIEGKRIESRSTHGTGCAFSSALLSRLLNGKTAIAAVRLAKEYVAEAIRRAIPAGHGIGPMYLLWPLDKELSEKNVLNRE